MRTRPPAGVILGAVALSFAFASVARAADPVTDVILRWAEDGRERVVKALYVSREWGLYVDGKRHRALSKNEESDLLWAAERAELPKVEGPSSDRLPLDGFVVSVRRRNSNSEWSELTSMDGTDVAKVKSLLLALRLPASRPVPAEEKRVATGLFSARLVHSPPTADGKPERIELHDVVFDPVLGRDRSEVGRPLVDPKTPFEVRKDSPLWPVLLDIAMNPDSSRTIRADGQLTLDNTVLGTALLRHVEATVGPRGAPLERSADEFIGSARPFRVAAASSTLRITGKVPGTRFYTTEVSVPSKVPDLDDSVPVLVSKAHVSLDGAAYTRHTGGSGPGSKPVSAGITSQIR